MIRGKVLVAVVGALVSFRVPSLWDRKNVAIESAEDAPLFFGHWATVKTPAMNAAGHPRRPSESCILSRKSRARAKEYKTKAIEEDDPL